MAKIEQIPIILLTGFLGAGKTTLLSRWIRSPELDGAMVIVNELGEVGLDHRLLTTSTDIPILLESGCACCAAQEDLVATLERLFWDRLHKRITRFNWVLIESTGIADPLPVIDSLKRHALVNERYRVAGVVTALDAVSGFSRLPAFPECRNQLLAANLVVVTKTDIARPEQLAHVRDRLPDLAPHAKVLTSADGDLEAAAMLATLASCPECGSHAHDHAHHHHDHEQDNAHGDHVHAEHAEGVTSAFLPLPDPQSWTQLITVLDTMMQGYARSLLRMKGIVRLEGAEGYHAVQATPGQGITRVEIPVEPGDTPRTGFTLIAVGDPAAGLASSMSSLVAISKSRATVASPDQAGAAPGAAS